MFEDFITALFGDSTALFIKCVWEKGGVSWEVNAEKWILWWQRENELRRRRRLHPLHMKSAISGSEKWSYSQHLDTPVVFSARVHQKVNSKHFILSCHKNQFHVFSEKLDFFVMWKSDEGKNKIFIQKIEFWVIFFSPRRRMFADDLVSELICRVSLWSQNIFFCIGREPDAELFQCKHNIENTVLLLLHWKSHELVTAKWSFQVLGLLDSHLNKNCLHLFPMQERFMEELCKTFQWI